MDNTQTLDPAALQQLLYGDVDGYSLCAQGRERIGNYSENFTYGEVTPEVIRQMLDIAKARPGEVFYDLGSGTGKAVLYAIAQSDLARAVGVEILDELHTAAQLAQWRYLDQLLPTLPPHKHAQDVQFRKEDILITDLSDANIIFTHCTCFSPDLMSGLTARFASLAPGTRFITVSRELQSPHIVYRGMQSCQMAWGNATMYFYERV